MPEANAVKLPFACQFKPPSMLYSTAVFGVDVMVIVPLSTPHSVGLLEVTLVMAGCTLSVIIISASATTQVPS